MREGEAQTALDRIAAIDADFASAAGWGSWMVMCANEREALVDRLQAAGHDVQHRYLARTASGGPVD